MYPIEKYKFYTTTTKDGKEKVIAISTYAGRTVRGVAYCAHDDTFSLEKGKELAAARCAEKIAEKRMNRAVGKLKKAAHLVTQANTHFENMDEYVLDAENELIMARAHLEQLLETL